MTLVEELKPKHEVLLDEDFEDEVDSEEGETDENH